MALVLVAGQVISASGTNSITAAHFNNTVAAGNAIFCAVVNNDASSNAVSSVTDSAGSVYSRLGVKYLGNSLVVELWATFNAVSSGSPTQTVSATAANTADALSLVAFEVSGMATSGSLFDQQTGINSASASSLTTPNITTQAAEEILIAIGAQNNTNRPYTAGAGYTMQAQIAAQAGIALETQIVSAIGTYNASMTIDIANPFNLALFAVSATNISATPTRAAKPRVIGQSIARSSIF